MLHGSRTAVGAIMVGSKFRIRAKVHRLVNNLGVISLTKRRREMIVRRGNLMVLGKVATTSAWAGLTGEPLRLGTFDISGGTS